MTDKAQQTSGCQRCGGTGMIEASTARAMCPECHQPPGTATDTAYLMGLAEAQHRRDQSEIERLRAALRDIMYLEGEHVARSAYDIAVEALKR